MPELKAPRPNYQAEVSLFFGDKEHLFRLSLREIGLLQNRCGGVGFGVIFDRIMTGGYFVEDVYETLRLGLEGGKMPAAEATKLVDAYIIPIMRDNDPASPYNTARAVLAAAMFGLDEIVSADEKEKPLEDKKKENSDAAVTTGGLTSPSSTDKGPASGGRPRKSRRAPSTPSTPP